MLATIAAWLEGTAISAFFSWCLSKIQALIAQFQTDKADQLSDAQQSAQDTAKAGALTPDSPASDVSDAINDETSHF